MACCGGMRLMPWFCHGSVVMHAGAVQGVLAAVARALSGALVAVTTHGAGLFSLPCMAVFYPQ
jgi:hypothetical protein